ncbi:MAG TPA: hypothetical protein VMI75_21965 [Polyangiaceae bacterium]|nr:hypothetical protein [Polyangiaceae bacterium]
MRKVAILTLAFLLPVAAACEAVLPFDRSLIPKEAGASGTGSPPPEGNDAAMPEDSAPMPDSFVPSGDGGDAAVSLDGSAREEGGSRDGNPDGVSGADASAGDAGDASDASDASDAGPGD